MSALLMRRRSPSQAAQPEAMLVRGSVGSVACHPMTLRFTGWMATMMTSSAHSSLNPPASMPAFSFSKQILQIYSLAMPCVYIVYLYYIQHVTLSTLSSPSPFLLLHKAISVFRVFLIGSSLEHIQLTVATPLEKNDSHLKNTRVFSIYVCMLLHIHAVAHA